MNINIVRFGRRRRDDPYRWLDDGLRRRVAQRMRAAIRGGDTLRMRDLAQQCGASVEVVTRIAQELLPRMRCARYRSPDR